MENEIICDECGATFPNTEMGVDGLWTHCCQMTDEPDEQVMLKNGIVCHQKEIDSFGG